MSYGIMLLLALVVLLIIISLIILTYVKSRHLPLHILGTIVACYLLSPSINFVARGLGINQLAVPGPGWAGAMVVIASTIALLLVQLLMLKRDMQQQRSHANDYLIEELHCVLDGLKNQTEVATIAEQLGISKQRVIVIITFITQVEQRVRDNSVPSSRNQF